MIIAHIAYDERSLRAWVCYSWYIAAVLHLHHALTVHTMGWREIFRFRNAIPYIHMLCLLPLVKKFWILGKFTKRIPPKPFS